MLQSAVSISSVQSTSVTKRAQTGEPNIAVRHAAVMNSPNFATTLSLVERVISQNISQDRIGTFRGVQPLDFNGEKLEIISDDVQKLHQLWIFQSEHTRGFTVKTMAWNTANPDILGISFTSTYLFLNLEFLRTALTLIMSLCSFPKLP